MTEQISIREKKKQLRSQIRSSLSAISEDDYQHESRMIVDALCKLIGKLDPVTVHLFSPMLSRREPDIRALPGLLTESGRRVAMPVVRDFSRTSGQRQRLMHAEYLPSTIMRPNRWGILEPEDGRQLAPREIDLVVVPAVGVDPMGHRLGHGFGYYDEFLAEVDAPLICPILEKALLPDIPVETHDIPVTYIVCGSRTVVVSTT